MSFAVLTINTTLSATMEDLYTDPNDTHSFTFSSGAEEDFYVLDDDAIFDDYGPNDTNQVVAPASTIFLDNTPVASRHKFTVTPDNGDPAFTVYVVFENSTTNDDFSPLNTLDYAFVSETPMIAGVNYSISNQNADGTVAYSNFSRMQLCFAAGTRIRAAAGEVPAEALRPGDLVWTLDDGLQPLVWTSHTTHRWEPEPSPGKPVLFAPGALGPGLPRRDLIVSPQHRMLVGETLCPAKGMTGRPGIRQMHGCREIELVHLLFARHQIVEAEGVATESFYPGRTALRALRPAQRVAIARALGLPPDGPLSLAFRPARPFHTVRQTREMLATAF